MRLSAACLAFISTVAFSASGREAVDLRWSPLAAETLSTPARTGEPTVANTSTGFDEMLRGTNGLQQRWTRAPELVVLTSVMEYHTGQATEYVATAEQLTDDQVRELTTDLTAALAALSGHTFETFAAIRFESVAAGAQTRISRPGQIVAGRYRGVRTLLNDIGLGGRTARTDGTITSGAIVLDNEYDRTGSLRRLLRTHELGHALGYNHVQSRASIMNPRIGSDMTDFDRAAAMIAFQGFPARTSN